MKRDEVLQNLTDQALRDTAKRTVAEDKIRNWGDASQRKKRKKHNREVRKARRKLRRNK